MKFSEKKLLRKKINTDILIGICVGLLGNATYIYLSKQINPLIVIGVTGIILLILIYRKEDEISEHIQVEIVSKNKIDNYDILNIKDSFLSQIKVTWKQEKGDIKYFQKEKILQFVLEGIAILKITFGSNSVYIDYYQESAEAQYLIEKFMTTLKEYKSKQVELFNDESFNRMNQIKVIPGPVIHRW